MSRFAYCCGNGEIALRLAEHGAEAHGIDIFAEEIETAKKAAEACGLASRTHFAVMDAEAMGDVSMGRSRVSFTAATFYAVALLGTRSRRQGVCHSGPLVLRGVDLLSAASLYGLGTSSWAEAVHLPGADCRSGFGSSDGIHADVDVAARAGPIGIDVGFGNDSRDAPDVATNRYLVETRLEFRHQAPRLLNTRSTPTYLSAYCNHDPKGGFSNPLFVQKLLNCRNNRCLRRIVALLESAAGGCGGKR